MAEPPLRTNVVALLVHPDGRYLLHLRDANKPIPSAGLWSLPGGHPEPGEIALVRQSPASCWRKQTCASPT
ncbi:NUDIX domain-containing protein [Streptomyces sp. NPDC048254]|uniref:NUDIX domain-containing protein n=1 Tax=Streptomyces sp. NPDC048254 TaxID=3365525 RepID=UPI0037185244